MITRLILIRHGVTDWNQEKRYCGHTDVPLSLKGKEQVKLLGKRLKKEDVYKVYSSDLKRTVQSARIIFKGLEMERVAGLRELNFGCFEGLSHKEILKNYPQAYKMWMKDPSNYRIPFGECLDGFKKRVLVSFKKIVLANRNKTIAVVSHGGTLSIFLNAILKKKDFWGYIPQTASLSIVEHVKNKPRLVMFNDTSHLNEKFSVYKS